MVKTMTAAPTRKAMAGTAAAGFGQQVGEVVLYILERMAGDFPEHIDKAVVGIVTALLTLAAIYYMPPAPDEGVTQ